VRERFLVTGAGGFVGRHMTRHLSARGAVVIGMDAPDGSPPVDVLAAWPCDIVDSAGVAERIAAAAPDAVVHLAGQSSAAASFEDPTGTFRTNVLGTASVLDAVRRAAPRARVLVVGTSESYGPQAPGSRVREDSPLRPVSPYALSKAAAEAVAEFHARVHGLDVVCTRSFSHIGPGQSPRFAIPGFARQIAAIEAGQGEPVLRVGNLDVVRDFTDVRDVVEAYERLIDQGRAGAVYNVCRGQGTSLSDVVHALCARARGEVRIEVDPSRLRPADVAYLVGDPSAIEAETGWRAGRTLESSLDEILEEWRHDPTR
jgi:GDP-4-dehydro-6-deoxy-D-mannose reductase